MFDRVPSLFTWPADPGDNHYQLAIHAQAEYLVTWETRMLGLAGEYPKQQVASWFKRQNFALLIQRIRSSAEVYERLEPSRTGGARL